MKLTKTIRDAFVRQVMDDVPSFDYDEQVRAAVMKLAVAELPPKIRAAWNDTDLRKYVATYYCYGGHVSVTVPGRRRDDSSTFSEHPAVQEILALKAVQSEERKGLRDKLRGVAYSVTTHKALSDALPEFAKYLPPDEAAVNRSLPVVANVVASFVKAGWPKGVSKAKVTTA